MRECTTGFAPATVLAVSFSVELVYEVHVPNASLFAAYTALRKAGKTFSLKLFGARAVDSMRMEKGFLHWKADILAAFNLFETGLDRFVKLEKGSFVGQDALRARHSAGPQNRLVTLDIDTHPPTHGGRSLMEGKPVVGTIRSGDWGHRTGLNLAYAFSEAEMPEEGRVMQLDLRGALVDSRIITPAPCDPEMQRVRALCGRPLRRR